MIRELAQSKMNELYRSLKILRKKDRQKILALAVFQTLLGFMDLIGVLSIGILSSIALSPDVNTNSTNSKLMIFLQIFGIEESPRNTQLIILLFLAIISLVGRTIISIYITKKSLYFLSKRGALLSSQILEQILTNPNKFISTKSYQELIYAITFGVEVILLRVLGVSITLLSDLSLTIVIFLGLAFVDLYLALFIASIFGTFIFILNRMMKKRALHLGNRVAGLNILGNEKVLQSLSSHREVIVGNKESHFVKEVFRIRSELSEYMAEITYLPYMSKYYIEILMVFGSFSVGLLQFTRFDLTQAIMSLTLFLASASRIAPALLRLQQGNFVITSNVAIAAPTFKLIEDLNSTNRENVVDERENETGDTFSPSVELKNVTFKYINESFFGLEDISFKVEPGMSIAIVGSSGAGKSTLLDIVLGVLEPTNGVVKISGVSPKEAFCLWPGQTAYIPQDIYLANLTIRENIAFGVPSDSIDESRLSYAIENSYLNDFIDGLPLGVDSVVGENGTLISGGQKQRLGIARALYTLPNLLVLDEATSALDSETEAIITQSLKNLKGKVTTITVAHRLSTVRDADNLIYLRNGRIAAIGTFNEVREKVPEFGLQAGLMGL